MKVLVVGGGGREHALCWKLAQSPYVDALLAAPGNPGMAEQARCHPVSDADVPSLVDLALREEVGLVVVGPEAPLVAGLADALTQAGVAVFGPGKGAAEIEGSKAFAKEFMARHGIPTALARIHDTLESLNAHLAQVPLPVVVKASGLAAGKGVVICHTREEAMAAGVDFMERRLFGTAGDRVVVEECLMGPEVSFLALCDGKRVLPLAASQDHKTLLEGDRGPNTGGMGAVSPVPVATPALTQRVVEEVLQPTVSGLAQEGRPFQGLLYAGIMVTPQGPRVLEFNARFGDPETQPLMMRMDGDLLPLLAAAAAGELGGRSVLFRPEPALCVVMASGGYPGPPRTGHPIHGLPSPSPTSDVQVFHAGTRISEGRVVNSSGRVLGVTARGKTVALAREAAYRVVDKISFDGAQFRRDIGHRSLAGEGE